MENREQRSEREQEPLHGRRDFLTRSFAGGIGASLSLGNQAPGNLQTSEACSVSPSDSLVMFIDLIGQVESTALIEKAKILVEAAVRCRTDFEELNKLVNELEAELKQSRSSTQARQLRELSEASLASARVVTASLSHSERSAYATLSPLIAVAQHIEKSAQDLLPDKENMLSRKASQIVNSIVKKIVTVATRLREEAKHNQDEISRYQQGIKEIQGQTKSIKDAIYASSKWAAVAEDPHSSRARAATARTTALTQLDQAINGLRGLIKQGNIRSAYADPTKGGSPDKEGKYWPVDLLIALLEGSKRWIANPDGEEKKTTGDLGGTSSPYVLAAHRTEPQSIFFVLSRVKALLWDHCPPGTLGRAVICAGVVKALRLYLFDIPARESAIRASINAFGPSCDDYPNKQPDLERLISELAKL